jgi:apolipoprotein N-acyltransferase
MYLSFPSFDVWFLKGFPLFAWFHLVPLIIFIRDKKPLEVYYRSFIAGLFGCFITFEWIGNFGAAASYGRFVILLPLIPFLAAMFAVKIWAAEILSRRFEGLRFLIYPSVWISVNMIESIGFFAYPMTYIGYSQYPVLPIVQTVSVTGILGLNFIIVMWNLVFADAVRKHEKEGVAPRALLAAAEGKKLTAVFVFVMIIFFMGCLTLTINDRPIKRDMRVEIVQSCISPWENWAINRMRYLDSITAYTRMSLDKDPDLVIWSESASIELITYDYSRGTLNEYEIKLFDFIKEIGKPLLTGEIGVTDQSEKTDFGFFTRKALTNSAVLIDEKGDAVKSYAKMHLVPLGEWFPYGKWLPSIKRIAESVGGSSFVPGKEPVLFERSGKKFGVLICYEGIFNRICAKNRKIGADFFVNITNDGWTHAYRGHMQHYAVSVFRAVEFGIWYVRAGNTGKSAVIDPYGRVRATMPIVTSGSFVGDIDFTLNHITPYFIMGDTVFYISALFIFALIALTAARTIMVKNGKN